MVTPLWPSDERRFVKHFPDAGNSFETEGCSDVKELLSIITSLHQHSIAWHILEIKQVEFPIIKYPTRFPKL